MGKTQVDWNSDVVLSVSLASLSGLRVFRGRSYIFSSFLPYSQRIGLVVGNQSRHIVMGSLRLLILLPMFPSQIM